ncbi:MAG: hypothetical protein ABH859_00090 [Pseudomonadota bacterium]
MFLLLRYIGLALGASALVTGCDSQEDGPQTNNRDARSNPQISLDSYIYNHPEIFRHTERSRRVSTNYQDVRMLLERHEPEMVAQFHQNFAQAFPEPVDLTPISFVNFCAGLRSTDAKQTLFTSRWHELAQRAQTHDCLTPLIASKAALLEFVGAEERESTAQKREQMLEIVQTGFNKSNEHCPTEIFIAAQECSKSRFPDDVRCELHNDRLQILSR